VNNREKEREISFTQTEQQNRDLFIERLVKAGWPRWEAEEEWDNIQSDEESEL